MTRINLLPWREERRARRQRDFVAALTGAAVAGALAVVMVHVVIGAAIGAQEARNEFLKSEIARLNAIANEMRELDKTKARLTARFDVIAGLQSSRPLMVKAFDQLARVSPETLYLSSVKTTGTALSISGTAQSNYVISEFMRALAQSPSFKEPQLRLIDNRDVGATRVSAFELTVERRELAPAKPAPTPQKKTP
ncbi:type IV pilus assembly protein PilN [Plasticicumulans lactativorans]|uniref:Type IV pilus assembly protein PilN n=1 Tax=Plasticicumulans lactativorans TaxID=1133106 RepID=A0A4R2L5N7_9GAMM|nr:PilN domain-containing protein [Plasticicumulans lactativorans]TCO81142.1 type IV pilus assembly protein PilN [Plasticicumulans lactativorans]